MHAKAKESNKAWDTKCDQIVDNFQTEMYKVAYLKQEEENKELEAKLLRTEQPKRSAEMIAHKREKHVIAANASIEQATN